MKFKIYFLYLSLLMVAVGCNKFFDVKPSPTNVNPTTVGDFKEMLNADSNAQCNYLLMDIGSDDDSLYSSNLEIQNFYFGNNYLWKQRIWDVSQVDNMYNSSYLKILPMNIILERVTDAKLDGTTTEDDRSIVRGQALINRAYYYWQLANIYGPAYDASSATIDLTVPLITTANANVLPNRATSQEMYNFIITDLRAAVSISALPSLGVDVIHPGKASGYALLARTYLYMRNYDSAALYADSALSLKNTLLDYTTYQKPTQLLSLTTNPEVYLGRFCVDQDFYGLSKSSILPSNSLFNLLTQSDLRFSLFFEYTNRPPSPGAYYLTNSNSLTFDYSISVPEMLLTKAECLSRNGQYDAAITIINNLRQKRMYSSSYYPILNYDAANTDSIVFAERRKELYFHGGLRWFDLKRLNKEGKYTTTLHRYDYDDNYNVVEIATLLPNSPNYVMPFSSLIVDNNHNIIQNVRN